MFIRELFKTFKTLSDSLRLWRLWVFDFGFDDCFDEVIIICFFQIYFLFMTLTIFIPILGFSLL